MCKTKGFAAFDCTDCKLQHDFDIALGSFRVYYSNVPSANCNHFGTLLNGSAKDNRFKC